MWKGTIDILNPKPTMKRRTASPATGSVSCEPSEVAAAAMFVVPVRP